jgi:hypothetical protein
MLGHQDGVQAGADGAPVAEGLTPADALREGESAEAHAARLLQTVAALRTENAVLKAQLAETQAA